MPSAQLIVTHGTTDLQLLVRTQAGQYYRAVPERNRTREFHAWLLEQTPVPCIVDSPENDNGPVREVPLMAWEENTAHIQCDGAKTPADIQRDTTDGAIALVLPKIDGALQRWYEDGNTIDSVLILSTDRNEPQESIATAHILKNDFTLNRGVAANAIEEYIFLSHSERLEGKTGPVDASIVQRLENKLQQFINPKSTVLLAHIGGLPQIKPLLTEMVLLLAGARARNLYRTELGEAGLIEKLPQEVLRVRRQCLAFVQKGAFLEAYVAATPYHADPQEAMWVDPLRQAASFINGNPVSQEITLPALRTIVEKAYQTSALLVAIRVESALLGHRWIEAINGSTTFIEMAIRDAIGQWNAVQEFDHRTRRIRFKGAAPGSLLHAEYQCLIPDGPGVYKTDIVGKASATWIQALQIPEMKDYFDKTHGHSTRLRPVDLRNYATHGILTQQEIDTAIQVFAQRELWANGINKNSAQPGQAFIGRKHTRAILQRLLGTQVEPLQLYQDLIQSLVQRLKHPHADA